MVVLILTVPGLVVVVVVLVVLNETTQPQDRALPLLPTVNDDDEGRHSMGANLICAVCLLTLALSSS